jgi:PhnB protein
MKSNTYLFFNRKTEEAFKFYQSILGGKVDVFRFGDSPMKDEVPAEYRDYAMHAELNVGDVRLMGSDGMPGRPEPQPQGFDVCLRVDTNAEAERIFAALSEGGRVTMPMAETFFAHRFGSLVDRFGVPWMVLHEKPA